MNPHETIEELSKEFHELTARVAKKIAGECQSCGGSTVDDKYTNPSIRCLKENTCQTCAPLREIADGCWHEWKNGERWPNVTLGYTCNKCNLEMPYRDMDINNPTYTIQTVRARLKVMGLWDEFKSWFGTVTWGAVHGGKRQPEIIDTLTSDQLILEAAIAFLKGRE